MNKYGNKKTVIDGIKFDSKKEAARYQSLKLMEKAKEIHGLELQPKFPIVLDRVNICTYIADFMYYEKDEKGRLIIEDVKGMKTPVYNLKKKLMKAVHGIEITEV